MPINLIATLTRLYNAILTYVYGAMTLTWPHVTDLSHLYQVYLTDVIKESTKR